jgi:hypothetical protein
MSGPMPWRSWTVAAALAACGGVMGYGLLRPDAQPPAPAPAIVANNAAALADLLPSSSPAEGPAEAGTAGTGPWVAAAMVPGRQGVAWIAGRDGGLQTVEVGAAIDSDYRLQSVNATHAVLTPLGGGADMQLPLVASALQSTARTTGSDPPATAVSLLADTLESSAASSAQASHSSRRLRLGR